MLKQMATHLKNLSDFTHLSIPSAANFKFAIVVAQWNAAITGALLNGAMNTLQENGCPENHITIYEVPGTFELSNAAALAATSKKYDAVICLGCVIQGETRHFDFICNAVANGITNVGTQSLVPAIFGVLTTENLQQAEDRAGGKHGNKGAEAAITAIKMAALAADFKNIN